MSSRLVIILVSFIAIQIAANGIASGRFIMVNRRRQSKMERRERKVARQDFRRKCKYANEKFPTAPNTCDAPPNTNFKYVYEVDPTVELWKFQQDNCIIHPLPSTWFTILFYMVMIVLVWIILA